MRLKMKVKVLIFYASYGGGHLSAAKAMKEVIQKKYPSYEIEVIDCMEYLNKPINFITVKLYEEFAKKMPKMWGWVYRKSRKGFIAGFSNGVNRMLTNKLGNANVWDIKEKRKTKNRCNDNHDRL